MSITTVLILIGAFSIIAGGIGDAMVAIPKKRENLLRRKEELECKSAEFKLQLSMKEGAQANIENPYEKLLTQVDEDLAKLKQKEQGVMGCSVILGVIVLVAFFYFRKRFHF